MFHTIDFDSWNRREIFELFEGYLYCMTVELDITEFLCTLNEQQIKFYPAMCYCIAQTVNGNQNYRYAKINGEIGYWDRVHPHYTLLRKNTDHLFTHQRTFYSDDFSKYYRHFLEDKEKAENGDSLYYDKSGSMDNVHISTMPNTSYTALSYSKPASFTHYGTPNTSFIPFVMIGKYYDSGHCMKLPVTVEFHHAVNDGYHAEQFFHLLEETCRSFQG
ncbi:CatA-like O-acetyltransferase [bacterium]|nr:CatA-like O-acetyltransferase [bacterium]MCI7738028.1 CatA-like O-acetyltransferase [Lachnospiraceae bacterium]MDY3021101.1 CatA-like O-acetyltransferase [Oliverpabstia sp.]